VTRTFKHVFFIGSLLVAMATTSVQSTEPASVSVVNPTRAYGYTLGDVLQQSIRLQGNNALHTIQQLPIEQREGRWITRNVVELSTDGQWLNMQYQIINAPESVRTIALPALSLQIDETRSIDIPAWPFSIAPLIPATASGEHSLPAMQPDWQVSAPQSASIINRMKLLAAALCLVLLAWLTWWLWRGWQEARSLPFAQAWHKRKQYKSDKNEESSENWLALHRAFDQVAGRSVSADTLDSLVNSVDWLKPFHTDIQAFYRQSSVRFFAPDREHDAFSLSELTKRLYLAERRNTDKVHTSSDRPHNKP